MRNNEHIQHSPQKDVSLLPYVTMKVGGNARFFSEVKTVEELRGAVSFARENNFPLFILGGGSNVVVSDEGFNGLVIKMDIKGISFKDTGGTVCFTAGAGEEWDHLVFHTVEKGLSGLENLSYIPGTVGATPVQNVGAYGTDVSETIDEVRTFDTETLEEKVFTNKECDFSYRMSLFKKDKRYIVMYVTFKLFKDALPTVSYEDVKKYFEATHEKVSPQSVRDAIINIRKRKLPDPKEIGTVGSYFKNPFITKEHLELLQKDYPDIKYSEEKEGIKVSLAWILDHVCGLKGLCEGNVGLYETQPLSLIHFGGGSAQEIRAFAEKIKKEVETKTKIKIEEEVLYV